MAERLTILPQPIMPAAAPGKSSRTAPAQAGSFDRTLAGVMENKVGFSRHAQERMASRGIHFSDSELQRLNGAVDRIEAKGGRDSLVLMDKAALVVSVTNRQVVTVLDQERLKDNVFTNIDSAIIA